MHIEIFPAVDSKLNKGFYWHFKNKGRITADAEAFPTRANAARAAQSVVKAVIKRTSGVKPNFTSVLLPNGTTKMTWL